MSRATTGTGLCIRLDSMDYCNSCVADLWRRILGSDRIRHFWSTYMQTKLTLRLDDKLIRRGKAVAKKHGKSLSQLVGDYFHLLDAKDEIREQDLSPTVRSLLGCLKGANVDKEDYYRYLEEKYR